MHVWRIAYEAYRTKDKGLPENKYQFDGLTDEEILQMKKSSEDTIIKEERLKDLILIVKKII